jgi:hypothetical protein
MPEPPSRKRFQIHLPLAIVMMFVAGGFVFVEIYFTPVDAIPLLFAAWDILAAFAKFAIAWFICQWLMGRLPRSPSHEAFQIHLSTAIAMMVVAGVLLWANTRIGELTTNFHGTHARYQSYGWPNPAPLRIIEYRHEATDPSFVPIYFLNELVPDFITAWMILFATWFICEWPIRRRAARKGA